MRTLLLALCIFAASPSRAALLLTEVPAGMRKQSSPITLSWNGGLARVHLRASTVPGGGVSIAHYDSLHLPSQTADGSMTFSINPDVPVLYRNTDLRFGVNYCILTDGKQISPEFTIIVESGTAPLLNSPGNAASLKDLTPTFSWSGSAPYYTLLVSDEPFKITDSGTVSGVSAIWQIITPFTSARYGDADPSGSGGVPAPPLVSGKTYNWLVLNNYGNNAAATSKVAPVPFSFTYAPSQPLAAAQLLEPADLDTIPAADQVKFRWALVDGAVSYKLELLEENTVDGSQADLLLWKASSTGGEIILEKAASLLRRYRYKWRVYAVGSNGSASLSVKRSFFYAAEVGDITVTVKNTQSQAVAYVPVKLNRLGGVSSGVFQSGSTDNSGSLSVKNAPLGKYELIFENVDGYLPRTDTVDHASKAGTARTMVVTAVPGRLLGRVTGANGSGILNAKVSIAGSDGSVWTALTNSQGNYSLGLPFGNWRVSAKAEGFAGSSASTVSLSSSSPAGTLNFVLQPYQYVLSGTVRNSFSLQGIFGATVSLTQGLETRTVTTDGNGSFSFSAAGGAAALRASNPGFAAPEQLNLSIDGDKTAVLGLDPNASILSGRTRDGGGTGLPKVSITAVPRSGPARGVASDNQGFFELSLPAGDWVLSAASPGFTARTSQKFLLDASKTVQGVEFTLDPDRAVIKGRVTEGSTGLPGVKVTASTGAFALSDNSGYYALSVPAGNHTVAAERDGYLISKTYQVPVNAKDTVTEVNFPAVSNAGTARGKVVAGASPVIDAQVSANNLASHETFTRVSASDGSFLFSLPPGDYRLEAGKEGFALLAPVSISLLPGGSVTDAKVKLEPNRGNLTGTVASGNLPLSGCAVDYLNVDDAAMTGRTVTDPDGRYSVSVQAGAAYEVTAACGGYQKKTALSAVVANGGRIVVDVSPVKAAAGYAGSVVDNRGQALAGVKITASRPSDASDALSDFSGRYQLALGSGGYTLSFSKPGYRGSTRTVQLSLGANSASRPDTLIAATGRLAVRVTAEAAGVAGAFVGLQGLSDGAGKAAFVTDAEGRFTVESLPAGNYALTASAEGFSDGRIPSVNVSEGKLGNVEVTLAANRGSLSGTARIGSALAPGVKISASAPGISRGAVTGADGRYLIDRLPAGSYSVSAAIPGFTADKTWDGQSLANPGAVAGIDFAFAKNEGALSGTVSGATGAAGIGIALKGRKGFGAAAVCDAAGKYSFPSLPADDYTLTVTARGYKLGGATQNPEIHVVSATVYHPALVPAVFNLTGKVLNQIGLGLSGLPVELLAGDQTMKAVSSLDGSYTLSAVPAGQDYLLSVKPPTGENDARDTAFALPLDAPADVKVDLNTLSRRTGVSGTVLLDGAPIEGALLRLTGAHNDLTALSQPGGIFKFAHVAGSDSALSLRVSKGGAGTLDTTLVVSVVESKTGVTLRLKTLQVSLAGVLKNSEGKPIAGGKMVLQSARGLDTAVAGADGGFAFAGLAANQNVTLGTLLKAGDYDNVEKDVSLKEADDSLEITAAVHATAVTFEVKDQDGAKVDGAEVVANGRSLGVTVKGALTARGLARGDYGFRAGKVSFRSSPESRLTLSGDTAAALSLVVTKVTGGFYGTLGDSGLTAAASGSGGSKRLPGAVVSLISSSDTLRDTVNELGQYFLAGSVSGRKYRVLVTLPGYRQPFDSVTASDQAQSHDIVLAPIPGSVVGRVTGASGEKAGIAVQLFQPAGGRFQQAVTAPGGYFAFTGLQNRGAYALQAGAGTSSPWQSFTADAASATRLDLEPAISGGIRGKVMAGSDPVSGALVTSKNTVTGASAWALSDTAGNYLLSGLPAGRHLVSVERSGYGAGDAKNVAVAAAGITIGADFQLAANRPGIGGTVVDAAGRGIVAEALLVRGGDTLKASSSEGGQFLFAGIPQGNYQLSATSPGYAGSLPVTIAYTGLGLRLQSVVLARKHNRIVGTVRDAVTNLPARQVTLTPASGGAPAITDSLGQFEIVLAGSEESPVLLDLSKEGYVPRPGLPVYLDGSGSASQDFALTADYKFDGQLEVLVKEGADTLPGLLLSLQPFHPDDEILPSVTGKAPTAFQNLRRPAAYLLKVKRSGFKDLSRVIELPGAAPVAATLAYPTGQIRLFVTSDGVHGKGADINLNGTRLEENQDTAGLYVSGAKLQPDRYEAAVHSLGGEDIPLASHFMALGADSVRTDTLPLSFRFQPIADSITDTAFSVKVVRDDSLHPAPAVVCSLYYRQAGVPSWSSLRLDSTAAGFLGEFPAQSQAGLYEYYLTLRSPQGVRIGVATAAGRSTGSAPAVYSTEPSPGRFNLRDPHLLHSIALLPQRLEADTSLYSLSAKDIWQVRARGENGRNLDAYFDAKAAGGDTAFTAAWRFTDAALAAKAGLSIETDPATPRLARFRGGKRPSDSVFVVECAVRMGSVRLQKSFLVKIQDLTPVSIGIKYVKENRQLESNGAALMLANDNTSGYAFSAFATTFDGRAFNIAPHWTFGADSSVGTLSQQGVFTPDTAVARGCVLRIDDTLSVGNGISRAFSFATNVSTFAQVAPAAAGRTVVDNGEGVKVDFNRAGLSKAFTVTMKQPKVSGLQRSSPRDEVVGDIIEVELSESQPFKADSGAVMTMPVQPGIARQRKVYLGHWNTSLLAWEKVDSASQQAFVGGKVKSFSKYAVVMGSLPLGAYDFVAAPNPFSSEDPWGLQFGYKLSSDVSSQVGVKIEIYNMLGDKVYESIETQLSKGENVLPGTKRADPTSSARRAALGPFVWDGRDSQGTPCRNGRYLLKLTVKDGKGSKEYLKKVVMLK